TTSAGRLFDTVAALVGFTRPITFEGQAAMWLEHLARGGGEAIELPCRFEDGQIDWRETLIAVVDARLRGCAPGAIARPVHRALAGPLSTAARAIAADAHVDTIVLSGGVMQNDLLLLDIREALGRAPLELWTNSAVPPNDGGVSLGQAALAVFHAPCV